MTNASLDDDRVFRNQLCRDAVEDYYNKTKRGNLKKQG